MYDHDEYDPSILTKLKEITIVFTNGDRITTTPVSYEWDGDFALILVHKVKCMKSDPSNGGALFSHWIKEVNTYPLIHIKEIRQEYIG